MKRLLLSVLLLANILATPVVTIGSVSAATAIDCSGSLSVTSVCKDSTSAQAKSNPIIGIIKVAINIVSFIVGVAAIVGIIVGAIRMIVGGGDTSAQASARSSILYAVVGIVVVILAQTIVVLVLDKLK